MANCEDAWRLCIKSPTKCGVGAKAEEDERRKDRDGEGEKEDYDDVP